MPKVQELANLTVKELINLTNLTIKSVEWCGTHFVRFTLSNGDYCTSGSSLKVNKSHTFDQNKKITKVEVIINKGELYIMQINFYSGQETLVKVGDNDAWVKKFCGRVEIFEIAADEQLIGAEIYVYKGFFIEVTWLKCKIAK